MNKYVIRRMIYEALILLSITFYYGCSVHRNGNNRNKIDKELNCTSFINKSSNLSKSAQSDVSQTKVLTPSKLGFSEGDDIISLINNYPNAIINLDADYFVSEAFDCSRILFNNHYLETDGKIIYLNKSKSGIRLKNTMLTLQNASNIVLTDLMIENKKKRGVFAIYIFGNCSHITIEDFVISSYYNGNTRTDGIHLHGKISNVFIKNGYIESGDDAISICADDTYDNIGGDISDISIDSIITGNNTWAGLRLYYQNHSISNVTVRNSSFNCKGHGVIKSTPVDFNTCRGSVKCLEISNIKIRNSSIINRESCRRIMEIWADSLYINNVKAVLENPIQMPLYFKVKKHLLVKDVELECLNSSGKDLFVFIYTDAKRSYFSNISMKAPLEKSTQGLWTGTNIKEHFDIDNWHQEADVKKTGLFYVANLKSITYSRIKGEGNFLEFASFNKIKTSIRFKNEGK